MSARNTIDDDLKAIDPVDEHRLDQLEGSGLPRLLLERVLSSDPAASPPSAHTPATTPTWRRRGPRLVLGGGLALAAVGAALILSAGSDQGSTAFAVEPQPGGGLQIAIHSLSDPGGLEAALAQAGIRSQVTYLPAGMTCREPHYTPSVMRIPEPEGRIQPFGGFDMAGPGGPMTIGIGNLEQRERMVEEVVGGDKSAPEAPTFTVDPEAFSPDQTLILWGSSAPFNGDPEGGHLAYVRIAEGPVEPCEPIPTPPGGVPMRSPQGT